MREQVQEKMIPKDVICEQSSMVLKSIPCTNIIVTSTYCRNEVADLIVGSAKLSHARVSKSTYLRSCAVASITSSSLLHVDDKFLLRDIDRTENGAARV